MAASQDRKRDIDNRHQDHQQHQASRPSYPEPTPPSTCIKLQLQTMSPVHPPSKPTDQWKDCNEHGPVGHDCYSPNNSPVDRCEQGDGHNNTNKGHFDQESAPSSLDSASSCPVRHQSHSLSPVSQEPSSDSESMYRFGRGDHSSSASSVSSVNPFSAGPSSLKLGGPLYRTSSVGRSSFIGWKPATIASLSGACGPICRCSNEYEERWNVKVMRAARKRMSVHSLLC
ncbi:hypothetical protein MVEG_11356 [Podila verticillata NRRL 6337]|uniref:Uncharacterized protein n=1 Tax=Podila verticillata NRRL 6337 TaxID=1069443 RepID=A0A086TLK4_9FUNG|nr:hypothetical protein MVEG_11356 [Podila verticillata NRRL 6337]